jgi:hypothetical protein
MEYLSIVIGLIGLTPLGYISYNYLLSYLPARKFLAFDNSSQLDVILTTSSVTESPKGAKVQRATTGIGQVQGVSHLSKFIGKFYKNKSIDIHLGKGLIIRPTNDIVLLGGPSKNEYSKRFIQMLIKESPDLNLQIDDENSKLMIKDKTFDISHLCIQDDLPNKDIGIVICWKNPFSPASESGRAVYCAGLTSYGTSGSALWLFNDILTAKGGFKTLVAKVGKEAPNFVAVLNLEIVNGGVAAMELVDAYKIKR